MSKQISTHAAAAKAIRTELKKHNISAKVRCSSYTGGDSVTVSLSNELPATVDAVKVFADQFQAGHFDGMTDMYEYSNNRADIPQVKFVFVQNDYSNEIKQAAWDWCRNYWGGMEDAPESYAEACSYLHKPSGERCSSLVHRALNEVRGGFWSSRKQRVQA
ncbi:MAG: LPD29 domain-containing protein [Cyanobacteria bacterium P01_F01_bin.3]